jgi:transposase
MSKDEKIAHLTQEKEQLAQENIKLHFELEHLKKLVFGQKRERFVPEQDSNQGNLFATDEIETKQEAPVETKTIQYERKRYKNGHPGRQALPDHLPVEEIIIEPEEDTTGMKKIGEERTETLTYTRASLVKKVVIRPIYLKENEDGTEQQVIAPLPSRPIPKGIAEASLLAYILVCKFVDHLPFYRQIQAFQRDFGWAVYKSTLNDWFNAVCTLMKPLYDEMIKQVLADGYIKADESPIKVQDQQKSKDKGGTHQGYQWVYYNPLRQLVVFNYRKGRGMQGPKEFLKEYQGWVQCDGYTVYDKIGRTPGIHLAGCLAHVRRKFFEAQDSDKNRATFALEIIKQIYAIEKELKEKTPEERKQERMKKIAPLFKKLKDWADEDGVKVTPKSPMGKAMTYLQNQWPKITAILEDGRLDIDNNTIENKIRPMALGRKNYLFAGSHKGAENIAMMYTFFGTCKARGVNPMEWLEKTLEKIGETKITELHTLLPGYEA